MTNEFSQSDLDALAFCVEMLRSEPDISYKEARREARLTKGLSVRRQVWTSAKRELGIGRVEEVVDASMATPSTGADTAPEAQEDSPPLHASGGAADAPDRWPQGRRPAWATPRAAQASPPDTPPATSEAQHPIEFMIRYLQDKNPDASFEEVRVAAEYAGYTVYPATFGRAQALAGILDSVAEGEAVPASVSHPTPPAPEEAPVAANINDIDPVEGFRAFASAFSSSQARRDSLRDSLEDMLDVVRRALED